MATTFSNGYLIGAGQRALCRTSKDPAPQAAMLASEVYRTVWTDMVATAIPARA